MSISAIGPTYMNVDETSGYANPKDELGRDQFLALLVAQLQHQDPLNPLEGTDFTAQLAQFSSLEQLFAVNESLTGIQEALSVQENGDVLDYIGKRVKATGNTILVNDGRVESGSYGLDDSADVTVSIYDSNGMEVRRLYPGWQDSGEHELSWDGRDSAGYTVQNGIYTFEIEARDEGGFTLPYRAYLTGDVSGIIYENDTPYLMIGDKLVAPSNIIEVQKAEAPE
jgi:flagellar basal-body rod modification protein FlgD